MSSFIRKKPVEAAPSRFGSSAPLASSFDIRTQQHIPSGCKLNISGSLVASTGIASLDALLGDGLPVSRILMLLEDQQKSSSNYANTVLKCFLAQGLVAGNGVVVCGEESGKIVEGLPGTSTRTDDQVLGKKPAVLDQKMNIAWRYKHIQAVESSIGSPKLEQTKQLFNTPFDLSKTLDPSSCKSQPLILANPFDDLEKIKNILRGAKESKGMVRIGLRSFGSPLFRGKTARESLSWFSRLRELVRTYPCILLLTIPSHLHSSPLQDSKNFITTLTYLCDTCLHLHSFAGTPQESEAAFREYQGLLRVLKPLLLPDSYALAIPETTNLAFKTKQRRFVIEKLSLAPEDDRSGATHAHSSANKQSSSCGTGSTSSLDF